jgi:hypothetical protein
VDVLTPNGAARTESRPLTKRPRSLAGRRIGILDNSKPNADALLGRIAEMIAERAGGASIRTWRKPGSSYPATNVAEVAAASDVVLTGSGD